MNPLLLTAGFFSGGPVEDAVKMVTTEKTGTLMGAITSPLGEENTKMEAGLEMMIGIGTTMLPLQARIPVAGALALFELFSGDWGDALGHLMFALPIGGKAFNLKSMTSGAKFAQKEALRLAKVFNKKGAKALAKELGTHAGTLKYKGQKFVAPFTNKMNQRVAQLQGAA